MYATVAIFGELTGASPDEADTIHTAFLDTFAVDQDLTPETSNIQVSQTVELGVIPAGHFYFELIVHYNDKVLEDDIVDSVFFREQTETPPASLNLVNFDFLVDTDDDGIDDENERMAGTDLTDPESYPKTPIVDLLLIYDVDAAYTYASDVQTTLTYIHAVTQFLFEHSDSPITFRPVALIATDTVDGLSETQTLPESQRQALSEEYGADAIVVFRPFSGGICGFAEAIGGIHDRGFLHPSDRAIYTEVFLSPAYCGVSTTAHEIGHLMGLGHSFAQGSTGAFYWSRGHGIHGEFATIMTYAYAAYKAVPLDVFSDPSHDCHSKPCGIPYSEPNLAGSADATRSLNITKFQFARNTETASELDFDEDGFATPEDAFPLDASEWIDSDADGYGDNSDAFVNDPTEWSDSDGDGIGDNSDSDIDGDGILNVDDANPFDAEHSTLMLARIVSDEIDAQFGWSISRINDIDSDGFAELAIAAPFSRNEEDVRTGRVYVASPARALQLEDVQDQTPRDPLQLRLGTDIKTWIIVGSGTETQLGKEIKYLSHTQGDSETFELFVSSENSAYLLRLDETSLEDFDALDDAADKVIHISGCNQIASCVEIGLNSEFIWIETDVIGDIDEDGLVDLAFLATNSRRSELHVYIVPRAAIDRQTVPENQDTSTEPITVQDIWQADDSTLLIDRAGLILKPSLVSLGNLDDDPGSEIGISIVENAGNDFIYILSTDQLGELGDLDADSDRRVDIDALLSANQSYRIAYDRSSRLENVSISHIDPSSDLPMNGVIRGKDDFLAWGHPQGSYLFTSESLSSLDEADGELDGSIHFSGNVEDDIGVWLLNNFSPTSRRHAKILRDPEHRLPDKLVAKLGRVIYIAEMNDLAVLDDPRLDHLNQVINLPAHGRSEGVYAMLPSVGPYGAANFGSIESLGDLDDDGIQDFAIAIHSKELEGTRSSIYLFFSSDIDTLDRTDLNTDHRLLLQNNLADIDDDGIPNIHDEDDDGDLLIDSEDHFAHDAAYRYDADRDGVPNALDAFPLDRAEQFDIDFDGVGDNEDEDADGDGIPDEIDEFPYDTDNDGIRNRLDDDDDNDGVEDDMDAFPLDPDEHTDTDGDGVGDSSDQFVNDPTEWLDTDGDGIGNNADEDDDNDGYPDAEDAFPLLATEWRDTDGDGVGDNTDQFPHNALEWEDKDGDGFGDNFGVDGFGSYRLVNRSVHQVDVPRRYFVARASDIGDMDGDGKDDIAINVAQTDALGFPMYTIVASDLSLLDEIDSNDDHLIDLANIAESSNSWKFENLREDFDTFTVMQPAGDLDVDGTLDLVVTSPFYPFFGQKNTGVYMVYGRDLAIYDELDGRSDHVIDFELCVLQSDCRMLSLQNPQSLHLSAVITQNWFNEGGQSIGIGSVGSIPRTNNGDGRGGVYILAHDSIVSATQSGSNKIVVPTDFSETDQATTLYPEYGAEDPSSNSIGVWTMSDFNGDNRTDLLVFHDSDAGAFSYVFASEDIVSADAADGTSDAKLDLQNVYTQPHSFRLDGFEPAVSIFTNTADFTSVKYTGRKYFPYRDIFSDSAEVYLLDLARLIEFDELDGSSDGQIESFPVASDSGVWKFENLDVMQLCPVGPEETDLFVLGRSIDNRYYVSNIKDVAEMDASDATSDGVIDFKDVLNAGLPTQWELQVGSSIDEDTLDASCIGDIDGDSYTDFGVSFKQTSGSITESHIVLLTYDDLLKLDELDGEVDGRVDVLVLWRGQ